MSEENKKVVLYIDDDQDMLDSIRMILESNNYQMEEATTAEEGLRKFKEVNPDLILVDLMIEEVDSGRNLVKDLNLMGNKAPIYMISSVGDALNMEINFGELGLAGVFQKPLDPKRLINTIKHKLGN